MGGINGQPVESARPKGAYGWRAHAAEDWMSRLSGDAFVIRPRDRDIDLAPGGFFVIPRGVEHMPVRAEERRARLFEPAATKHYGD